jgi:hypothetical protein
VITSAPGWLAIQDVLDVSNKFPESLQKVSTSVAAPGVFQEGFQNVSKSHGSCSGSKTA